jgi:hypothetical protein
MQETNYIHECATQKDFYQFLEEGIYKEGYYYDCSLDLSSVTWSLSENMMSKALESSEVTGSFEIIALTSTTLKLKINSSKEIASPAKLAVEGTRIYIFTKV